MNKFGVASFLTVLVSVILFFVFRGPNANLSFIIGLLSSLSILGIVFAIMSKKWLPILLGTVLNGGILIFTFYLLLAKGIGG
jgi:hypothetical protein